MLISLKAATLTLLLGAVGLNTCTDRPSDVALGVLARERVALTAVANEIIVDLPVPEGTAVTAGTILVQLDDTLQKASLDIALAQLARAQADLDKLVSGARIEEIGIAEARVAAARAVFGQAQATFERNSRLLETRTITPAQLDQDRARRNSAQAELTSAEQTLAELTAGAREEDIRVADAQRAAAQAQVSVERTRLENLTIRASRDGVLDSLPWNLGERVPLGSPIAILLAGDTPFARVYIPEPVRVRLHEGDRIGVKVDGLDTVFDGRLRWISEEPAFTPYYALNQEQRSRLVYLAEIELPAEAASLPAGIPVEAYLP